ncbi:MAG: hypothetical protein AB7G11_00245 [Phycisphaerales bacterium]
MSNPSNSVESHDHDTREGKDEALAALRMDALGAGGMEAFTEGAPKKRVPAHVIMLGGLVLVAGGALMVMRHLGMGPLSASGEVKIDYETKNVVVGDHERVLRDLTSSHIEQQVPKEQVQRNPFRIADSMGGLFKGEDKPTEDQTERERREQEERERKEREARVALLKSTAESLRVHSILGGSRPIARINDETVQVGDLVAELFHVKSIEGRTVELEADGTVFVLMMDEPTGGLKPKSHKP